TPTTPRAGRRGTSAEGARPLAARRRQAATRRLHSLARSPPFCTHRTLSMQAIADRLGVDFLAEPWFIQILLIIALTAVAGVAAAGLLRLAGRVVARAGGHWGETLVRCARRPLLILIWAVGIAQALLVLEALTTAPLAEPLHALRKVTMILCIAWFL